MKKILSTLIMSSLLIPTFVAANERRGEKIELRQNGSSTRLKMASSTRENGFCSQIDKIFVHIETKGVQGGEKRSENVIKREEKRDKMRTEIDIKREENNTKRKTQLEELTLRATTDEQKKAVLLFSTAVDKALADKKTAIDALLATHRTEVNQYTSARKTSIDNALATLKKEIEVAKTKAKSDCATGATGEVVRTTLKDSIQKAQQSFKATMQSLKKDTRPYKKDAKKQELQTIEDMFKKSVEQAKINLKAAFKTVVQTTTTTN